MEVVRSDSVDVVVEATGIVEVGARVAYEAILGGKHVVMLNVETDVTVGAILGRMAQSAGVVYTGSAGDEPGAIMELYDFARSLGFESSSPARARTTLSTSPPTPSRSRKRPAKA